MVYIAQKDIKSKHDRQVLQIIREKTPRFFEITKELQQLKFQLSSEGLRKVLQRLKESDMIEDHLDSNGKKRWHMTSSGSQFLDNISWPIADYIDKIDRSSWAYSMITGAGIGIHVMIPHEAIGVRSYYNLPLLEIRNFILEHIAIKSMDFFPEGSSKQGVDLILSIDYDLNLIDQLTSDFLKLIREDSFDPFSSETMHGMDGSQAKRIWITSLITMLNSIFLYNQLAGNKQMAERANSIYDNVIVPSLKEHENELFSDLNVDVLNYMIDDVSLGKDIFEDRRIAKKEIISPMKEIKGFENYNVIQYLTALRLKAPSLDFIQKLDDYLKGTQGILLRLFRFKMSMDTE